MTGVMFLVGAGSVHPATVDLEEYLPYKKFDSSSLRSTTGTGFEFRFFSPSRNSEFDWDFRKTGNQPFRRSTLRKSVSGLQIRGDTFYDPTPHTSQFDPDWIISPIMVDEEQVILSSSSLTNIGSGFQWMGAVDGTVTIGTVENRHTPVGKVDVLPLTISYTWSETGPASRGSGLVTQTWWLTKEIGAFQVRFNYEEIDTNDVFTAGSDEFHLQTSTLLTNSEIVTFPDPNLEAAVRTRVGKPTGDVTASDMAFLLDLNAPNAGITDLTGLEYAYRMASLTLAGNNISDASILSELPRLAILNLAENSLTDIQPLSGLTNLHRLTLSSNAITSSAALQHLTNLTHLYLTHNQITDLDALQNHNNLRTLYADENLISDVSGLTGLPQLEIAILGSNRIVDVAPCASLPLLVFLEIEMNLVHDLTPLAALDLIQASVEENCLDVTPGADDRMVIEGWIAGGTSVEEEWPLQFDCEPTIITIGLAVAGDVPALQWPTEEGDSYQIESSTNLLDWVDVPTGSFSGTGGVVKWMGDVTTLPQEFYRVRLEFAP